jgi:hypothetical protein
VARWHKHSLGLDAAHSWRARPGNKILLLDRGAARFEFPERWVVEPDEDRIEPVPDPLGGPAVH